MKTPMEYTSLLLGCILLAAVGRAGIISVGNQHFLALKSNGTVWAWGENRYGVLGDGTSSNRLAPVQVIGPTDVISVSAGFDHSLALRRDGAAWWAWGDTASGQLRDGIYGPRQILYSPVQVAGLSDVIAIEGGEYYSLALKSDGTAWAWGVNYDGQLGDGTTVYRPTPVQVVGLSDIIAVSAGGHQSLALKRDGTVWQWGYGYWDGKTNNYVLLPSQVSELSNVISISVGYWHSLALKRDGTVWAWGYNNKGQIGDGTIGDYTVTNPVQSHVSGVIAIAAGKYFSLALTSYGVVWFWGYMIVETDSGMPSDVISSPIPIPVDGISGVIAIAAGGNHALALKNDGTLWAWGLGYLGDGKDPEEYDGILVHGSRYPVQVQGFSSGGSVSVPSTVLAADFDEDGKADPTAISSSGELFYWNSSQSFSRTGPISLGLSGSVAAGDSSPIALAAGDADGDGKADLALVDSAGLWHFFLSSRGYLAEAQNLQPTVSGPQPLLADFDGDGKADPTIVSSTGLWTVWLSGRGYSSASGSFLPPTAQSLQPVAADFDADGRADPVMVDANGNWYFYLSSYLYQLYGNRSYNFGVSGKPVAGDFDGDGKADPCIVDSTGNWNLFLSGAFYLRSGPWYLVLP